MAPANIPYNFVRRVPLGDERERLVCDRCDFIHYDNPRIPVGAVCTWEAREAWEEARVRLEIDGLLAIYDVLHVAQVQLIYRARLAVPEYAPDPESFAVELYDWKQIPRDELAFPTVRWVLQAHRELGDGPLGVPCTNPPGESDGRSPE